MPSELSLGVSKRLERIFRVAGAAAKELSTGVEFLELASGRNGAEGFSTGIATFTGSAELPWHTHPCGESITVLEGRAAVAVEHRVYELKPFDSLHVPSGVPHALKNLNTQNPLKAHTAFGSAKITRALATGAFSFERPFIAAPPAGTPESLARFTQAKVYELAAGTRFQDLFAGRLGAKGICGGYGRFSPGSSLPCHLHDYDESISIIEGTATCLVAGRGYALEGGDTALIPHGLPHRFINAGTGFMTMIWVYAGDEPERTIVEESLCLE